MNIHLSTPDNVLQLSDIEALDAAHSGMLQSEVAAVLGRIPSHIQIDLTRTRFVDCEGLGALVGIGKLARRHNAHATIQLVNPPPPLSRIVQLTGLDATFTCAHRGDETEPRAYQSQPPVDGYIPEAVGDA